MRVDFALSRRAGLLLSAIKLRKYRESLAANSTRRAIVLFALLERI